MSCPICLCDKKDIIKHYIEPDQYMSLINHKNGIRFFKYCFGCGLVTQKNSLTDEDLENIYKHYRDRTIRQETIQRLFKKIKKDKRSENTKRLNWLIRKIKTNSTDTILDIGAGFGIWPDSLKPLAYKELECIEPNEESSDFINSTLKIKCFNIAIEKFNANKQYDLITMIHVLEHIRNPIEILFKIKNMMRNKGFLFIEVPDVTEFEYLDKDHDEFNSTHLYFFDIATLYRVITNAGFKVKLMERVFYPVRNLSRIRVIANA